MDEPTLKTLAYNSNAFEIPSATPGRMAALFALYASIMVLLLATMMPPYMNPDEGAHYVRADQVAHGGLIARRGAAAPALIDSAVLEQSLRFAEFAHHPDIKPFRALYVPVPWGGRIVDGYPNTALYPPFLYIPAAFAIRIGQHLGLTLLPTLELARGITGLASIVIGAAAIALAGPASVWLFAILCLPMTLSQIAAVGQDGPMIALAALAVAVLLRLQDGDARYKLALFGLLSAALSLIGMARPPYVALAVLPLLARGVPVPARWAAALGIVLLVFAWSFISVSATGIDLSHYDGTDARAQAIGLLWPPWRAAVVLYNTVVASGRDYTEQFVGQLGALDVPLSHLYRTATLVMLAVAALCAWRAGNGPRAHRSAAAAASAIGVSLLLMVLVQYLTWTKTGADHVDGLQGRYFLPLALVAGVVFIRPHWSGSRAASVASWGVLLFPVVTIPVVMHAILLRYYL